MKSWMHKLLRPAGCALAAGALGWTGTAAAQGPMQLPAGPSGRVHTVAEEVAPAADGYAKLAEMKVELAWLADPATFPYRLGARADGAALEVRGYVPNEAVREQALKLAREHSGLNVVDSLQIHDHLALRSVGRPVEELQQAAQRMLAETLKDLAHGLEVKARPSGQITVEGSVPSLEAKVAASQCLRKVGGCTGVANQLQLPTVQQADGKSYALISSDGRLMVPREMVAHEAELVVPATRPHEVVVQERAPVMPPRTEAPKPHPQQAVSRLPRLDAVAASASAGEPREMVQPPPVSQPSTPRVPTLPRALPTEVRRPIESAPLPPAMFAPRQDPMPAPREWPRPTATTEPAVKSPASVVVKPAQPTPVAKTPAVQQARGYATTGTISFDDPEPTTTPKAAPAAAPAAVNLPALQARLKQQIQTACALPARDLEVVATSAKTLDVRLKARSISQGEALSEKLFKMPELGPYEVHLDVQVTP
jgi:hypothetical protein